MKSYYKSVLGLLNIRGSKEELPSGTWRVQNVFCTDHMPFDGDDESMYQDPLLPIEPFFPHGLFLSSLPSNPRLSSIRGSKTELPAGTWRVSYLDELTFSNGATYGFRFTQKINGQYDMEIQKQPGYNGRSSDDHTTHRLSPILGNKKICFKASSGKGVDTLKKAQAVAYKWAQYTERYRQTGESFPNGS